MRILNLEDNKTDAELNAAMISTQWPHCEFVRVGTREDFVAALEQKNFDVILSDYSIPSFSGHDALALAGKQCPLTPFLFVSGTIGEDTAIEALKSGATDYVLKQRLKRLVPAVERALREAVERAECERAELAMRESEHKYREVFENLGEAAFLADEKTGKIIDTNRCAETMLDCPRSEILGHRQSQFLASAEKVRPSDAAPFQCALTRADGRALPVRVHTAHLTIHGHPLVLWLCRELDGP